MFKPYTSTVSNPENAKGWGCIKIPLVSLRAEPSEKAEMVTQALYGERVLMLELSADWVRVELQHDAYQGWCSSNMVSLCTLEEWNELERQGGAMITKPVARCMCGEKSLLLPAGSLLFYGDSVVDKTCCANVKGMNPADIALRFLHAPYLWGGKSILGMDCSGLVQLSYALLGVFMPRDAGQQVLLGNSVSLNEALPGDLAFFGNQTGKIVHVGLVMEQGRIIHASGSVRIDCLDNEGIFNRETGTYSHRLAQIRRLPL